MNYCVRAEKWHHNWMTKWAEETVQLALFRKHQYA